MKSYRKNIKKIKPQKKFKRPLVGNVKKINDQTKIWAVEREYLQKL